MSPLRNLIFVHVFCVHALGKVELTVFLSFSALNLGKRFLFIFRFDRCDLAGFGHLEAVHGPCGCVVHYIWYSILLPKTVPAMRGDHKEAVFRSSGGYGDALNKRNRVMVGTLDILRKLRKYDGGCFDQQNISEG